MAVTSVTGETRYRRTCRHWEDSRYCEPCRYVISDKGVARVTSLLSVIERRVCVLCQLQEIIFVSGKTIIRPRDRTAVPTMYLWRRNQGVEGSGGTVTPQKKILSRQKRVDCQQGVPPPTKLGMLPPHSVYNTFSTYQAASTCRVRAAASHVMWMSSRGFTITSSASHNEF